MNNSERGSSLIEVMGLLAIAGMIAVSLMAGISSVTGRMKITQAENQVARIVKNMQISFSADVPELTADKSATKLFKAGVYSETDVSSNGTEYTGTNVYGGPMTVVSGYRDGYPYFDLTYSDLPTKVCADLLQANFGDDPSTGLKSVTVTNENVQSTVFEWDNPDADSHPAHKLIPTLMDGAAACGGTANNITWSFYL